MVTVSNALKDALKTAVDAHTNGDEKIKASTKRAALSEISKLLSSHFEKKAVDKNG